MTKLGNYESPLRRVTFVALRSDDWLFVDLSDLGALERVQLGAPRIESIPATLYEITSCIPRK